MIEDCGSEPTGRPYFNIGHHCDCICHFSSTSFNTTMTLNPQASPHTKKKKKSKKHIFYFDLPPSIYSAFHPLVSSFEWFV